MALIGTIRKQGSWVLIVLIALGLGGFIIQDMFSGGPAGGGMGGQPPMAKINGEKIDINEFNRTESILYSGGGTDLYTRRNTLWNYYVEKTLINEEAEALGLGVGKTELKDLQFGPQPSPVIRQRFLDPNTGQINLQQLNQIRGQIESGQLTDPNVRAYWRVQEGEIIKERLQSKLTAMVNKGLYTPQWMAEMGHEQQTEAFDIKLVRVPFDEIPNTEVSLSDQDFKSYINERPSMFERDEEARVLNYVAFTVQPTGADSASIREDLTELKAEFSSTDNDTIFVQRNQGTLNNVYLKSDQVSPIIADTLQKLATGTVYGPYEESGAYRLVKLVDRKVIPDSVRSRHILLRAQTQQEMMAAVTRVDSIKTAIEEGGATWAEMNEKYNTDVAAKAEGGDLGFAGPNMMVKPFNDLIFYNAEPGELNTVVTQFGIHLVEVLEYRFLDNEEGMRLAFLSRNIVPSEETQKARYDEALTFLSEQESMDDMVQAVSERNDLTLETTAPLEENGFVVGALGSGQASRDMIRWAFNNKPGNVSSEIYIYSDQQLYYDNKYVVAALKSVLKPGMPSVDEVRADIEQLVINRKKGEVLAQQMAGKSLQDLATEFDLPIDTAENLTFSTEFVPSLGNEPKLLGAISNLDQGQSTQPIVGNSGVFVAQVFNKTVPSAITNYAQLRQQLSGPVRSQMGSQLMEALRSEANITDNRSTYY